MVQFRETINKLIWLWNWDFLTCIYLKHGLSCFRVHFLILGKWPAHSCLGCTLFFVFQLRRNLFSFLSTCFYLSLSLPPFISQIILFYSLSSLEILLSERNVTNLKSLAKNLERASFPSKTNSSLQPGHPWSWVIGWQKLFHSGQKRWNQGAVKHEVCTLQVLRTDSSDQISHTLPQQMTFILAPLI